MRLFVVGYPTEEADTGRFCLDRWTLTVWEMVDFCCIEGRFLERPGTYSHIPRASSGQVWVRRRVVGRME